MINHGVGQNSMLSISYYNAVGTNKFAKQAQTMRMQANQTYIHDEHLKCPPEQHESIMVQTISNESLLKFESTVHQ